MFIIFFLLFCSGSPVMNGATQKLLFKVGLSRGTVGQVESKDPTDELEKRLDYLNQDEILLLRDIDNEYITCRWYFVVSEFQSLSLKKEQPQISP
ncbi:hypothetical protein ACFL27_10330, partial [candidate division CSSED10-310 bacterium]